MSKSLVFDKEYLESIKEKLIILDNTFLVDLSKDNDDELVDFLNTLKENGCSLVTIPEVFQEFTRGAKSLSQYEKYEEIFNSLGIEIIRNFDRAFRGEATKKFMIAYNNETNRASLTDSRLAGCLFAYNQVEDMRLITANYKDMPEALLKRDSIFAYDMGGEIRTHGIYRVQDDSILQKTLNKYGN